MTSDKAPWARVTVTPEAVEKMSELVVENERLRYSIGVKNKAIKQLRDRNDWLLDNGTVGNLEEQLESQKREVKRLRAMYEAMKADADDHVREVERLRVRTNVIPPPMADDGGIDYPRWVDELEAEVERLRAESRLFEEAADNESRQAETLAAENERLRAALNRAGDRLAQVQPAVTEAWAFDIVPKAEQEIADALEEMK